MGIFDIFKGQDINRGVEEYNNTLGSYLIDVRNKDEYDDGHVPGSKNVPLPNISAIEEVVADKGAPIFVYCLSGGRSSSAAKAMKQMGYTNVNNIGGISAYKGIKEK